MLSNVYVFILIPVLVLIKIILDIVFDTKKAVKKIHIYKLFKEEFFHKNFLRYFLILFILSIVIFQISFILPINNQAASGIIKSRFSLVYIYLIGLAPIIVTLFYKRCKQQFNQIEWQTLILKFLMIEYVIVLCFIFLYLYSHTTRVDEFLLSIEKSNISFKILLFFVSLIFQTAYLLKSIEIGQHIKSKVISSTIQVSGLLLAYGLFLNYNSTNALVLKITYLSSSLFITSALYQLINKISLKSIEILVWDKLSTFMVVIIILTEVLI